MSRSPRPDPSLATAVPLLGVSSTAELGDRDGLDLGGVNAAEVDESWRGPVGSESFVDQWHCTVASIGVEHGRDRLLISRRRG